MDLCLAPQVKNYSTIRRVRPRSPGRLYRHRTGIPWRDLPARFGDWNPPKANRKTQRLYDFALYCARQPRRALLQSAQALRGRRHPLRQTRQKFSGWPVCSWPPL